MTMICQGCGQRWPDAETVRARPEEVVQALRPGQRFSDRECPRCRAMCLPEDPVEHWPGWRVPAPVILRWLAEIAEGREEYAQRSVEKVLVLMVGRDGAKRAREEAKR
jgi:hypothetical protein